MSAVARSFRCSLGGGAAGITVAGAVLLAPLALFFGAVLPWLLVADGKAKLLPLVALVDLLVLGLPILLWAMAPNRCELGTSCLRVYRRGGGSVEVPFAVVSAVEVRRPSPLRNAEREGGNGGFLGYTGWFRGEGLKVFEAMATTDEHAVVITRRSGSPLVISPDDPDDFVATLNGALRSAAAG